MKKVSIVIPCYNEEENIMDFYNVVKKVLTKSNKEYELIFVDDGSRDNTKKILKSLESSNNISIKTLIFSRNFGKEEAMYAGLKESTGDYVSIIDADLQQDPLYLLEMEKILDEKEDYDSVALFQDKRNESGVLKFFKKAFYKIMNKISEVEFVTGASDFRMFRRNMVNAIIDLSEKNRFSKGIFSWVGFNTYYLPYKAKKRNKGESKWSFWSLFKYAISGIVSFSTAPLTISTILGLFMSFISILYLIFIIIQKLFFGIAIPGYPTIVVLILLLGGIQLLSIGIIGEYLARTYIETKNRPIYILKEKVEKSGKSK